MPPQGTSQAGVVHSQRERSAFLFSGWALLGGLSIPGDFSFKVEVSGSGKKKKKKDVLAEQLYLEGCRGEQPPGAFLPLCCAAILLPSLWGSAEISTKELVHLSRGSGAAL